MTMPCTITGKVYTDNGGFFSLFFVPGYLFFLQALTVPPLSHVCAAVSIGGVGPVPVKLGAIDTQTKDFSQFQVVAGVMGLAGSSKGSVLSQLVQAGVTKDLWTLCLNEGPWVACVSACARVLFVCLCLCPRCGLPPPPHLAIFATRSCVCCPGPAAGKTANGTMTVGGIDTSLMAPGSSLQYVPNAGDTDGFYGLRLDGGITVGDDTTPLASTDGSLAIIDSGTNILLLPQDIYQSFSSVLTTMCQTHTLAGVCGPSVTNGTLMDGSCYHLSASDIQAFPNVTFHLQDSLTLHMSASDYLLKGDVRAVAAGDASLVCLGVRNTGPNNLFIVGDTLLRNYYTVFDRTQARIGFAPVNKAKCGSM